MNQREINKRAASNMMEAQKVLKESGFIEIWKAAGCRVNLVGSLRMGLLASRKDIDIHVYSKGITEEFSFMVASKMSANSKVVKMVSVNGLCTNERCMSWHVSYRSVKGDVWRFDIIHIEEGTEYDGYFEWMADRIVEVMSTEQRDVILKLKFETAEDSDIHGVEYYEAVIADGVRTSEELRAWVEAHRKKSPYYWIP